MKKITLSLSISLMSSLISLSAAQATQVIDRDLGTFTSWKTATVKDHDLSHKDACVALTKAKEDGSTLELYAEKSDADSTFVEPTIQVVTRGAVGFVRATLLDGDESKKFNLTLSSRTGDAASAGLMARLDDRAGLVALLKSASSAKVNLIGANGKIIKSLNFSLKGSTKGIEAAYSGCALSL